MPKSCFSVVFCLAAACAAGAAECGSKAAHPEWIFCDDFESTGPLVAQGRYFEYSDNAGDFTATAGAGRSGSRGMRARWQAGEVDAGNLKVSFGRNPSASMNKGIRSGEDFREIYYRVFMRSQTGWKGDPFKLSRATVVAKADWSQAMIAHLWGDRSEHLQLDPVRCVDGANLVKCSGYNDFNHMEWIGAKAGATAVFGPEDSGKWLCVEAHVKLNTAGKADGVHEFWVDDRLEARREGLNFVGAYKDYGLNAIFLENYWNSGSPQLQERYFDDFVISTARVGCAEAPTGISAPKGASLGAAPVPAEAAGEGPVSRLDGRLQGANPGQRRAPGRYFRLPEGR
jgi:hypothetical protein